MKPDTDRRCAHRLPPPPPDGGESDASLDLVFARFISYSGIVSTDDAGRPASQDIGLDLDDTCTGEGQGPSCIEPSWVPVEHYRDGLDGIDNALGHFFSGPPPAYPGLPESRQAGGTDAGFDEEEIVRISRYSGELDDNQVDVALYAALGLEPREDGGAAPLWDGNDRWRILPEMVYDYNTDQPLYADHNAYVSGGVLVARFTTDVVWPMGLSLAPASVFRVAQLVLTGSLVQVEQAVWELHDLAIAMRIRMTDVLTRMARIPRYETPLDTNVPICQAPQQYGALKTTLCSYEDIASEIPSSPNAPMSACDALSAAVVIRIAKQARLGDVRDAGAPPLPPCDETVHPENDTCP